MLAEQLVGIDEVGRGPWAGPIVAAAVRLHEDLPDLNDSKKLTKSRREQLSRTIRKNADIGVGWVHAQLIDKIGLSRANQRAIEIAYEQIALPKDEIIIDGNILYIETEQARAVVGADATYSCVSAASIIAKVARDSFMVKMNMKYPGYGFNEHVGYGTKQHKTRLEALGVSGIHRKSYKPLQRILEKNNRE